MTEYETEFSEFPKEWEVKRLNELAKIIMGQSPPSSAYNDKGQGLPFIQGSKDFGDIYPSIKTFTTICKKIAPKDSILFSVRAPVGDINISDREICIGRGIAAIVPYNKTDLLYLYYYLTYSAFKIKRYSSGTTFESIKERDLENFQITLPPLDERKKIVKILNTVDSIIIDTTNLIEKLRVIKEKTLNLLITGKIWHKEFKDTEIGRIPKNWEVVKLGSIAKISSGNTAPQEEKYFKNGKYPFIRVQHLKELQEEKFPVNYDFVNDYALSELKLKLFKKGCIVFPKSGESIKLEKRAMLKEDSCVVNHLAVIEPLYENIDNLFLFYYLCTIKTSNYLTETTMPSLNLSTIRNFLIPLPPLEEQKKIAEILSIVDNKIEAEKKYLDYMKKLKEKLLSALMTGKIRVNSIAIGDLR